MSYFHQKNIFQKAIKEVELSYTQEGWGLLLLQGGIIGNVIGTSLAEGTFKNLLKNKTFKKYLDDQIKKLFKQAQKDYPKYKIKKYNEIKSIVWNSDDNTGYGFLDYFKRQFGQGYACLIEDGHWIEVVGDSDHIRYIKIVFLAEPKSSSELKPKLLHYKVPAPTRQDLQDLGFRDTFS